MLQCSWCQKSDFIFRTRHFCSFVCFFWTEEGFEFWESQCVVIAQLFYLEMMEALIPYLLFLSLCFRLKFFCNAAVFSLNYELGVSQCCSVHSGRRCSWGQALSAVRTPQRPRLSAWRPQRRLWRARWSGSPESQVHVCMEQCQIWFVFMHLLRFANWFVWLTQIMTQTVTSFFPRLFLKSDVEAHVQNWLQQISLTVS